MDGLGRYETPTDGVVWPPSTAGKWWAAVFADRDYHTESYSKLPSLSASRRRSDAMRSLSHSSTLSIQPVTAGS